MSLCFHHFLPHTVDSYPDLFEPSHAYNDLVCQAEHLSCEGGRHLEAHPGRGLAGARWAGGQRSLRLELAEQTRPRQLRWSGHKLRLLMESLTRQKHDGKDGLEQGDLLVHDAIMHILRHNRFRVPGTILLTLHLYQIHILLFLSTTGLSGLLASPSLKLCASSTLIRPCSWACLITAITCQANTLNAFKRGLYSICSSTITNFSFLSLKVSRFHYYRPLISSDPDKQSAFLKTKDFITTQLWHWISTRAWAGGEG